MVEFGESLHKQGVLRITSSLREPQVRVRIEDERQKITDGPFAEAREMIGGFFLLDCETREEALRYAAQCPAAHGRTSKCARPVRATSSAAAPARCYICAAQELHQPRGLHIVAGEELAGPLRAAVRALVERAVRTRTAGRCALGALRILDIVHFLRGLRCRRQEGLRAGPCAHCRRRQAGSRRRLRARRLRICRREGECCMTELLLWSPGLSNVFRKPTARALQEAIARCRGAAQSRPMRCFRSSKRASPASAA